MGSSNSAEYDFRWDRENSESVMIPDQPCLVAEWNSSSESRAIGDEPMTAGNIYTFSLKIQSWTGQMKIGIIQEGKFNDPIQYYIQNNGNTNRFHSQTSYQTGDIINIKFDTFKGEFEYSKNQADWFYFISKVYPQNTIFGSIDQAQGEKIPNWCRFYPVVSMSSGSSVRIILPWEKLLLQEPNSQTNNFQLCSECYSQATHICRCRRQANIYLCKDHIGKHCEAYPALQHLPVPIEESYMSNETAYEKLTQQANEEKLNPFLQSIQDSSDLYFHECENALDRALSDFQEKIRKSKLELTEQKSSINRMLSKFRKRYNTFPDVVAKLRNPVFDPADAFQVEFPGEKSNSNPALGIQSENLSTHFESRINTVVQTLDKASAAAVKQIQAPMVPKLKACGRDIKPSS